MYTLFEDESWGLCKPPQNRPPWEKGTKLASRTECGGSIEEAYPERWKASIAVDSRLGRPATLTLIRNAARLEEANHITQSMGLKSGFIIALISKCGM